MCDQSTGLAKAMLHSTYLPARDKPVTLLSHKLADVDSIVGNYL